MIRISSAATYFYKRIFPTLWFGFLAFFLVTAILYPAARQPVLLIIPVVMGVFGFFLMKHLVWDLVDEVDDCGDTLRVRKGDEEETIPLSSIMNVNLSINQNPPRITLRLVNPGRFGRDIAFMPVLEFTLNPFARNRVAEDLIVRVDRARSRRPA